MFQSLIELADEAYSTRTTLAVEFNAVLLRLKFVLCSLFNRSVRAD